jgi:membrane protein YdbS with pleckstrin-like domain
MKILKWVVVLLALGQAVCLYFTIKDNLWGSVALNVFMLCTFHPFNIWIYWFKLND